MQLHRILVANLIVSGIVILMMALGPLNDAMLALSFLGLGAAIFQFCLNLVIGIVSVAQGRENGRYYLIGAAMAAGSLVIGFSLCVMWMGNINFH